MRRTGTLAIILALVLCAFGCGSGSTSTSLNKAADQAAVPEGDTIAPDAEYSSSTQAASNTAARGEPDSKSATRQQSIGQVVAEKISLTQSAASRIDTVPSDRKVIRNAEMSLESETPEDAQAKITDIAERLGGFVVESQQTSSDRRMAHRDIVNMSVRVPSERFGAAINEIRQTASRVVTETIKGDDVTEEFIDVEARLRAKKALESQFTEIMKRAVSIADALNVQSELAEVRGEIERIEGRKRYLENQSSLSTIKVRLQTSTSIGAGSESAVQRLTRSLETGMDFALSFVLGLLTFVIAILPFAVFIGLPVFFGLRYYLKWRDRPLSTSEIVKEKIA